MRFASSSLATLFTLATLTRAAVIEGLAPRGTTTTTTSTTTVSTVCACISTTVVIGGVTCGTLTEFCTCLSVVSQVVTTSTSTTLRRARGINHGRTVDYLTDRINKCDKKDRQVCTHPQHSHPKCSRKHLCGYECDEGYVDCNGKCKKTCPTGTISNPGRRDADYWGKRVQKSCQTGWTACGISGGGPRDWECVDTHNDLESCGGCPSGVVSSLTGDSTGADCTTIPHVADVSCVAGGCAVHKCLPGFKVADSGDACVEDSHIFRNTLQAAAAYGLEHISFHKKSRASLHK
ncbi:hypothetical protein C8R43DRAFT_919677 [Mycena crocata]|nr:hypothetical protein C8R43DRAFT_919677 [Mycena crocata]